MLTSTFRHPLIFILNSEESTKLPGNKSVSPGFNLHFAEYLSDDDFNMLIIDVNTLVRVYSVRPYQYD